MNTQRRTESTGNEFPERATLATLLMISFLPSRLAFALGRQVGALRFWWMGYRHPREIGTLVMYMSNRLRVTDDRSVAALRRSFGLITIQDLEGWFLPRLTKDNAARIITFEGVDNLNAALRGGRGAILFSGHTMSLMIVLVGLKLLGYGVTVIRSGRKTVDARSLAEWFGRRQFLLMEQLGVQVLYGAGVDPFLATRSINALKRNDVVVVLVDAPVRGGSAVEVAFINETTRMSPGSAILAATRGTPLLPLWTRRSKYLMPIGVIGPPLAAESDVPTVVHQQAQCLENEILRDPAGWRRWLMKLRSVQKHSGSEL